MRETNLRPIPAHDQIEFLDWDARRVSPARKVTSVLAKCGDFSEQDAACLTVGEREALLLKLRWLTFGERMSCVLECPRADCRKKMDLDLTVGDLLLPSSDDARRIHEASFDGWVVRFRLPEGADQEAVASLALTDESEAVQTLLNRCVISAERDGERLSEIPALLAERLSDALAKLDPQSEIVLEARCPACGDSFRAILDTASFFFTEVAAHARTLLEEVHLLASHYHWSEAAILAIPERRRRLYLALAETAQARRQLA
jgi:hypothetical protein